MPYFHATRRERLSSIYRHGLGGVDIGPVAEICERGVYLASDPRISIAVMVGQLFTLEDETVSPRDYIASLVIIVVDDARLDRRKLEPDPQVKTWQGSWLYRGVVDVTNAVLLTVDEVYAGWTYEPESVGWIAN
jgi:hypothetical protein